MQGKFRIMGQYKRYAFISYNHHDVVWADWLRKNLENFKLPNGIENEFIDSKYLRPIFRDQDDLNAGVLSNELEKYLSTSKNLVVICSPNSAKSEWVSNEVKYFIEHGRLENIIPFIVAGVPNSGDENECFPRSLREYVKEHPEHELLGVNVQEVGKQKSVVRIVSRILGVDFDQLWNRYERARKHKLTKIAIASPIILALLTFLVTPVKMSLHISEEEHSLPMPEQMVINVNGTEYPITTTDTIIELNSFPGYFRGKNIPISFSANYYDSIETKISLPFSLGETLEFPIQRDSTFAVYAGIVVDEDGIPLENVKVHCENLKSITDSNGKFYIAIPLEEQTPLKNIKLIKDGFSVGGREDESPSKNLYYMMRK